MTVLPVHRYRTGRPVRPHRPVWAVLALSLLLLPACGGGGGGGGSNSATNPSNPGGNPGNPGGTGSGPGGKGGSTLPYECAFTVTNHAKLARTQVAMVSIPFPEGKTANLDSYSVEGESTCWRVLQRWTDGSVRVAQAQFSLTLAAEETRNYKVVSGTAAWKGSFVRNPWVDSLWASFSMASEVKDIDGTPYYAFAGTGSGTVLVETPLVKVTRYRGYHVNANPTAGIGRDFLSLTSYVTEYRTVPLVHLDLVLGNDYHGADHPGTSKDPNLYPLGDVALKGVNVIVSNVPVHVRYAAQNGVGTPMDLGGGMVSYPLLHDGNKPGPTTNHYLADGQTKRWRFTALFSHPAGDPGEKEKLLATYTAMETEPLHALATRTTWKGSRALGLFGAFVDPPQDGYQRADSEYWGWVSRNHFGPFGSWGDTKYTGTTGTPRNCALSPVAMHVVQTGHQRLVRRLEGMAWQQACRPLHLYGIRIEPTTDIYMWTGLPYTARGGWPPSNENLGRKSLYTTSKYAHYRTGVSYPFEGPYGWNAYDNEHWTTDILFDYWSLTGDPWAHDELRHMGECAMGLLRPSYYSTQWIQAARSEGWMLASAVQIHLACGDNRVKDHFLDRIRRIVDRDRKKNHASKALAFQNDYPGTGYPTPHKFFMPWQHGPVLYGMVAANMFFQDPVALTIAEDVITMLDYSWVKNYNDPKRGFVANGLRYYVPVEYNGNSIPANHFDTWTGIGVHWGDSPLGGAHTFLICGLFYLSDQTPTRTVSDRAAELGGYLLQAQQGNPGWRWEKWSAAVPEYHTGS